MSVDLEVRSYLWKKTLVSLFYGFSVRAARAERVNRFTRFGRVQNRGEGRKMEIKARGLRLNRVETEVSALFLLLNNDLDTRSLQLGMWKL